MPSFTLGHNDAGFVITDGKRPILVVSPQIDPGTGQRKIAAEHEFAELVIRLLEQAQRKA